MSLFISYSLIIMLKRKLKKGCRPFSDYDDKRKVNAWSDDNIGTPCDYALFSNKKFKFICFDCNHLITISLDSITRGRWCIYCGGKKICGERDCKQCYEKSFAYHFPDKSLEWSKKNDNEPNKVMKSSNMKFLFDCKTCGHEYQMDPNHIGQGRGCTYCANKVLCDSVYCVFCREKTFKFLSPIKSEDWSDKNIEPSHMVLNSSNKKAIFDCKKCNHEYTSIISNTRDKSGKGCPYCANMTLCPDSDNCETCFSKSFASFDKDKVSCWSDKNLKTPSQYFMGSDKKVIFDCDKCHKEFSTQLYCITRRDTWCPHCHIFRNKSMDRLCKILESVDNITYTPEVKVVCEGRSLFWDMVVKTEHGNIHIESDGLQHFTINGTIGVGRGSKTNISRRFKDQRTRDLLKEDHIRKTGGLLFRFSYRQRDRIPEFVERMLKEVKLGTRGVIYLDTLYENWDPIEQ